MKQKIIDGYRDAPKSIGDDIAKSVEVADFLPPPNELRRQERKKKITISLDSDILHFFRNVAKRQNTKYQTMINDVLLSYTKHYRK